MATKLTHSPGAPPRLWVRASLRPPSETDLTARSGGASWRSWRQALHVDGLVGVAVGVLGPDDDGRRRPVRHAGAVEDAEGAGHQRRGADGLLGDLLAELGPGVAGAVEVVLPGDAGHDVLELGVV